MKTKHRILSVLTILALVASLTAVMVSPAMAIVGLDVVSVSPHVAGGTDAVYTIRFAVTEDHYVGDLIVVTFPAGTGVPSHYPYPWVDGDITVQGVDVLGATVSVIGRSVLFNIPAAAAPITAGGIITVVFTTAADIRNPTVPGTYQLKVRTVRHPLDVTSDHYTIGGITIAPTRGPVGTEVTVSGIGYVAREWVTVTFDYPPTVTKTVRAGAGGAFTTTFTVPVGTPGGAQPVTAIGDVINHTATFTVILPVPVITLSPDAAVPGTTITISGEHFPAGERLLVRWITADGMLIGFATAGGDGRFSTIVAVPLAVPGDYRIYVHVEDDDPPGVDDATLTIPRPVIDLTPADGPVRQPVTVTGENFPALSPIVIRWRGRTPGNIMLPPEAITNSLGAFTTQVVIPVDLSGERWIYAYVRDFIDPGDGLPAIYDKAPFTIEPGVPRIGVSDGFHAIWEDLDHSVWVFLEGKWYQHHTDPVTHALIDPEKRFEYLEPGLAYWFYLTEPIENVLVGAVTWTLSAGWHNRGWTP